MAAISQATVSMFASKPIIVNALEDADFQDMVNLFHENAALPRPGDSEPATSLASLLRQAISPLDPNGLHRVEADFCNTGVHSYHCTDRNHKNVMSVIAVDALAFPTADWWTNFIGKRSVHHARPTASMYLAIEEEVEWSFSDELWTFVWELTMESETPWWALTTTLGDQWLFGVFSDDRKTVTISPSISNDPPRSFVFWYDSARHQHHTTANKLLHFKTAPSKTLTRPTPLSRKSTFSSISSDDDFDVTPTTACFDPPPPPPARITRLLETTATQSVALGTRSKTLARKGFIARDEKTGKAEFIPLSDQHLEDMRKRSIWIQSGNSLSWNTDDDDDEEVKEEEEEDEKENGLLESMDTDLDDTASTAASSFFASGSGSGSGFGSGSGVDAGPTSIANIKVEEESWAYRSRQASGGHTPSRSGVVKGEDFDATAALGLGLGADGAVAWLTKWKQISRWQREHFGDQDSLMGDIEDMAMEL